jgi:predicted nucleic acid-binding protein
MFLIDTDVMIEVLRGVAAANNWLRNLPKETFAIPGIVAMELLMGCRNPAEIHRIRKFVNSCTTVWPDASESAQAYELLASNRLASGISIPDCLIAAMALHRETRLYTFNLKHFSAIPGLDVQAPYARG